MAEEPARLDPSASDSELEPARTGAVPEAGAPTLGWRGLRTLEARLAAFEQSAAGRYWAHLSTADFMNSSFVVQPHPGDDDPSDVSPDHRRGDCEERKGRIRGPCRAFAAFALYISFEVWLFECLHAGAVFGRMWNERQAERATLDEPQD